MSPLWLEAVPQSMFSIMPRSRQGALTTGLRPQYHTTYYAAFVLDPDGKISKPYATALNESRRARLTGGARPR